jgi:hypothetical protein
MHIALTIAAAAMRAMMVGSFSGRYMDSSSTLAPSSPHSAADSTTE